MSSPNREVDPGAVSASAVAAALPLAAADDAVLAWNSKAETLFGVSAGDALGRPSRDLDISFRISGLRAAVEREKAWGPAESLTAVVPPNALARALTGRLGIGLTLVRSLVEMHGGRVEVRSEGRGHGTEVTALWDPVATKTEADDYAVAKAREWIAKRF